MEIIIQQEVIKGKIYIIRGHKVMLSADLAELYEVEATDTDLKDVKKYITIAFLPVSFCEKEINIEKLPVSLLFSLYPPRLF